MIKRIKKLLGLYTVEKILIVPYRSYGTNLHLYIKGRVLDNEPLQITARQSFFNTVADAYRQFDTHEINGVVLQLTIGNAIMETVTDADGYFLFDTTLPSDVAHYADAEGWVYFNLNVLNKTAPAKEIFKGEFLIPEARADYGVISDIDDTILDTGVTSFLKWKVIRNSFFVNAYRRMPLEGAAGFYRLLHGGIKGKEKNPVFYLSNSPWNLYQYLKLFLDHNKFPKGPVLLRSFSSIFQRLTVKEKPHKQKEIINILETYPKLNFILIGDSGEHDASIYTDIAAQYPDRILCIYLRSVKHEGRMRHVKSIVDNFRTTPVLLVETSKAAEDHARASGFI